MPSVLSYLLGQTKQFFNCMDARSDLEKDSAAKFFHGDKSNAALADQLENDEAVLNPIWMVNVGVTQREEKSYCEVNRKSRT